jgi:signal transduction histidine kinase
VGHLRSTSIALLCLAGLVTGLGAYARQWTLSELPQGTAVETFAYPVGIGGLIAGDAVRLRFLAESWRPGTRLELIEATGRRHDVELILRQGRFSLVMTGLSGLAFIAAAISIFAPRLGLPGAGSFFWVTFLYGLGILDGGVFFPRPQLLPAAAISLLQICCLSALPVLFVRLALTFPRRSPVLTRAPWLVPGLASAGIGLAGWQAWSYLAFAHDPVPGRGRSLDAPSACADAFMVAATLAGVVLLALQARRLELTRERNQARWLVWGFTIGAAPYVFLRTLPALLNVPPPLPDAVDRLVELAIPGSFVMAVVRHQFLDVDVIIRRSLFYGVLAAACLGLYLAAGLAFGAELTVSLGLRPWILAFVLGLVAGAVYLPLRAALGDWIDRTFFKLAHDQGRALQQLTVDLDATADQAEVARLLAQAIAANLGPRPLGVVIDEEPRPHVAGDLSPPVAVAALRAQRDSADPQGELYAAVHATSLPETERADFPAPLAAAGVAVVVPLVAGERLAGAVFLGLRPTGRRFIDADLAFLGECRHLAGQALARIDLQRAVAAEVLSREQFALLSEHKSQFLAQVAHDLRTPLAGIAWSARNLLDGLAGELTDAQREYLGSIAQSGALLARLVENLLEISRLERAEAQLDLEDVDVGAIWTDAADTVRPLGAHKGAAIAVQPAAPASVCADRGKLLEVAVNLLDNAVKYTAPHTEVTIAWTTTPDDAVAVSVRDRGPGLRGQPVDELLARFFQGEPSPHSARSGFGLGLHIAASYLKLMQGSITAADHPDGGAVFTCYLPRGRIAKGSAA